MTTPTINAYSNTGQVKVVFPAGILQPPFFDVDADDAANYGAIGAVIGHEIGHQFDDGGSKLRRDRHAEELVDRRRPHPDFDARTACVVDQFNSSMWAAACTTTARQVLGEALGDLGGLTVALHAYHRSLGGKPGTAVHRRLHRRSAILHRLRARLGHAADDATKPCSLQLNTNPHPIAQWRAIATLRNMPEFQSAFQCKDGDPMVAPAAERCKLW